MKPFYVDFFEDLSGFVLLCKTVADSGAPQPVFYADDNGLRSIHFFLATPLWRAHLEILATCSHKEAIKKIEVEGGLYVIRTTVRQWSIESPVFLSPFDTSLL
jgi:hypothetical protein